LKDFAGEVRQLSSSARILSAVNAVRLNFRQLSYIFRENAANLLPGDIEHRTALAPLWVQRSVSFAPSQQLLDVEDVAAVLGLLTDQLKEFHNALGEFPEFVDDKVGTSILGFVDDLRVSIIISPSSQAKHGS
jgi:WD repeat-containing protein 26